MNESIKEQLTKQMNILVEPEQKLIRIKNELAKVISEGKTLAEEIEQFPSAEKLKKLSELENARKYLDTRIKTEEKAYNELKRTPSIAIKSIANNFIKNEIESSERLAAKKKELDEQLLQLKQVVKEYNELWAEEERSAIEQLNECDVERFIDHSTGRPYPDVYSIRNNRYSMEFLYSVDREIMNRGITEPSV